MSNRTLAINGRLALGDIVFTAVIVDPPLPGQLDLLAGSAGPLAMAHGSDGPEPSGPAHDILAALIGSNLRPRLIP